MSKILKSRSGKLMHISNNSTNVIYGALYNWYAASKNGGSGIGSIAPIGWHVPSESDFNTLATYLGGASIAGGKMKETGNTYWEAINYGATNESNFNGRGSGERHETLGFINKDITMFMWTSTAYNPTSSIMAILSKNDTILSISPTYGINRNGAVIRLLKNDSIDPGYVTDIDGNVYPTVKIGNQVWTSVSIVVTHYNDGTLIKTITDDIEWGLLEDDAMCYYDNNINNAFETIYLGNKILRKAERKALELTFDDISNAPVEDVSSINDWNTFFDLPTNGNPFTSVIVNGNVVKLYGGSNIILKDGIFYSQNYLIKFIDKAKCIVRTKYVAFKGSFSTTIIYLPAVTRVDLESFEQCYSLNILYLSSVTNLGESVGLNNVFSNTTGLDIQLTIPITLMTCNGGNPDGDIQYLIDYNTVTIYDPEGNQIYPV